MDGFIAQLAEHRTGNANVTGLVPVEAGKIVSSFHILNGIHDSFHMYALNINFEVRAMSCELIFVVSFHQIC